MPSNCCQQECNNGVCGPPGCTADGMFCFADNQCCSGVCATNSCGCKVDGQICIQDGDCCGGKCILNSCGCKPMGPCFANEHCCTNQCVNGMCKPQM